MTAVPPHAERTPRLTVRAVTSDGELCPLQRHWNELLQSSSADIVFLTWEWVTTWWRVYRGDASLYVLVAEDENGRLLGLAPLKRVPLRVLGQRFDRIEFIGCGGDVNPEYLDFIARNGCEEAVAAAFLEHLTTNARRQVLNLRPLRENSLVLRSLGDGRAASVASRRLDAVCPVFELPASLDAFLTSRSRNYRKKLREYEHRGARELSIELKLSGSVADAKNGMATLAELHRKRWKNRSQAFVSPEYLRFHQELVDHMLERGWIRMFSLETFGRPIAVMYCFSYGDRYYYYQAGWDPDYARNRVGLILMHQVIQQAISERARTFDFLRGQEPYKYRWATSQVWNYRWTLWSSLGIRVLDQLLDFRRWMIDVSRRALPSARKGALVTAVPTNEPVSGRAGGR